MNPEILRQINEERRARRGVIRLTNLDDGIDRLVREGEALSGELGLLLERAFKTGKSGIIGIEGHSYFVNVHLPPPRLVIIGAVHISQALAPMAMLAGFDVEIIDPRTAFAAAERFEGARLIAEWPEVAMRESPLDSHCALAAITHDPKIDDPALKSALQAGCFYVGALGSRKTHAKRLERLQAAGMSKADTASIEAPIGLDISAQSPAEIAVAILGSVIASYRRRGIASGQSESPG